MALCVCMCRECVGRRLRECSVVCSFPGMKFVEKVSKQEHPFWPFVENTVKSGMFNKTETGVVH